MVKQLVPRGSADRNGRVKVGDQLLRVGDIDVTGQSVSDMRHLIIGEIGSTCSITLRSGGPGVGLPYTVDLMRGTPEYFDQLAGGAASTSMRGLPSSTSIGHADDLMRDARMYKSANSTVSDSGLGGGASFSRPSHGGGASLQEENDWLRSALRLAESHVQREKEELKSLHGIFERQKHEYETRLASLEGEIQRRDAERRDIEGRTWQSEEQQRSADIKLQEAARREQMYKEEARKVYENEQMRLEYIQELKRRFEDEKRALEAELVRMHDSLRSERQKRVEAEAVEGTLRQELQRTAEAYRQVLEKNNRGSERVKMETEKLREIQRHNSSLTLLLSEIQPRLTVLEQDVFGSKIHLDNDISSMLNKSRKSDEVIMA